MRTILFVTNNYIPYSGGVVSSINSFKKGLERKGHRVFVLTLDFNEQPENDATTIRLYCPLKFSYKTNPMAVPWRSTAQLEAVISRLKPDLIHSHHPFLLGNAALACARKYTLPIVFTHHTQYANYLHYIPVPQFLSKPLIKQWVNHYCTQVDSIIAPSLSVKNQLKHELKKPIEVIPTPLDQYFFNQSHEKKQLHSPVRLLLVSRFAKEKNIYFLLDVFSQLPLGMFTFTLVGYGAEKEALLRYAFQTLQLSYERITFVEKPSKEDLLKIYKQSDIFLFSSLTETQGIVLAEAMACGLPIVALNAPGSQDIIEHGMNGFLVQTHQEMIKALLLLHTNHELYADLSSYAVQTSLLFGQDILCEKLVNVYENILGQKI